MVSGWKKYLLSDIGTFKKGSGISREEANSGNIPAVRYGEIYTTHNYCVRAYTSHISKEVAKKAVQVKYGDLLFACSGETKEEIAKCVSIIDKKGAYAGGDIIILSPAVEADPIFWGYILNIASVVKQRAQKAQGDAIVHISADSLKQIEVTIPPIEEQQKIAEALSDMDELIASLEKLISKKKAIKQGAMQELLTGKKRLPGFSGEWKEVEISELGSFISGNGFPLEYQGEQDGEFPFYKVSDFNRSGNNYKMNSANNYISKNTADILHCNIVPQNSIIFAKIGAAIFLERKRVTTKKCCIDNNMMSFQPYQKQNAQFICYVFQTMSFGELVESTALPSLSSRSIGKTKIQCPTIEKEQQAIASILSDMDAEIEALEQKLAKCRQTKQGMMQQLLTGKIRLV